MNRTSSNALSGLFVAGLVSAAALIFTPFKHVDELPQSNVHVVITSGHGSILKGEYQTAGKQSPTWPCGLKIYEGFSTKMLALDLSRKLMEHNIDVTYLNNHLYDVPLSIRVQEINEIYRSDSRIILLDLHHNAQPVHNADYTDFEGLKGFFDKPAATGIEVFTFPGSQVSRMLADLFFLPHLQEHLPDIFFRHNAKARDGNFYILRQTHCPAILIEFLFMTTYKDALIIANPDYRDAFTNALLYAILDYNEHLNYKFEKLPA